MAIYTMQKKWGIAILVLLAVSSVGLSIFTRDIEFLVGLTFLIIAYVLMLADTQVITDANGIKEIKSFAKTRKEHYVPWDWIFEILSYRSGSGAYFTLLTYAEDPQKRTNEPTWSLTHGSEVGRLTVTSLLLNYTTLLAEIKANAHNAQIDKTTQRLIIEGIKARKVFWILVILFL